MCSPDPAFYPLLTRLLYPLVGVAHSASLAALTDLVWALLVGQSLHPAALVRALPHLQTARARQAFRRVRRLLDRPSLTSARLTPLLLRAVLRLVPDPAVLLVLDSSRCRCWEVLTLGVRCHGRVLVVAWAVLPYPLPPRQFTPTTLALLDRVLTAWPAHRPVHLVADRFFPSLPFFQRLDTWRAQRPLGYTVRLRAGDWVRLEGETVTKVADLLPAIGLGRWQTWRASYRRQREASALATLVIGRGLPVYPAHQMGPADCRRRRARATQRAKHRRSNGYTAAASTEEAWALLSTHPTWSAAMTAYSGRFSTEGTYRDLKSWGWEAVVAQARTARQVEGVTGLAVLGHVVQASIGAVAGRTPETAARARQQQWTTTGRLSVFGRGRLVLQDRAAVWTGWLPPVLADLTARLTMQPVPPPPAVPLPLPLAPRLQEAA
jgi:hypothetical protein